MNALQAINNKVQRRVIAPAFAAANESHVILTMPDDSMTGTIEAGELICVKKNESYYSDGIYAFRWCGYFMVKRLQFIKGTVQVIPDSKFYEKWEIRSDSDPRFEIIGPVVQSMSIRRHY